MRIFVDTDVVLTGAFNPQGPAGKLPALSATFVVSPQVLWECEYLIRRDAPSEAVMKVAFAYVSRYLSALRVEQVEDASAQALDPDDNLILGSALAAKADLLCTYNVKDFPANQIQIRTPLSLHRALGHATLEQYIQRVALADNGTILFLGKLNAPNSLGPILTSENGVTVSADDQGFIRLEGPGVVRCQPMKPVQSDNTMHLTVRYNKSHFEAATWTRSDVGDWSKDVLTTGSAAFSANTQPILCFVQDHRFSAIIQGLSGLPRYVPDRRLAVAMDNYSLEALAGSLDLRRFLHTCKVQ